MQPKRPYLDSSVYIAAIKGPDSNEPAGRAELARHILQEAERGTYRVTASTWLTVEVHKRGKGPVQSDDDLALIDGYLQQGYIDWVELDFMLAMEARRLARQHSLSPADAVHLATAIKSGCDELLRWDGPWPLGNYEGVEVREPYWFGQQTLPIAPVSGAASTGVPSSSRQSVDEPVPAPPE